MADEPTLVQKFETLLTANDTTEQTVQEFIEHNTELFYPPFEKNHGVEHDFLLSKLQLDTSLTTDFAYLTKSSAVWWLVLVELEHPSKPLFTKAGVASAELNAAIHQVSTWKTFVKRNGNEVARRIAPLKKPLGGNKLAFKYSLVIGRSKDFAGDQAKTDALEELQRDDFSVMTYDSLIHAYQRKPNPVLDVVHQREQKFAFKLHHRKETSIFAWLTPNDIHLEAGDIEYYKTLGYDIDSWMAGKPLVTRRQTMETLQKQMFGKSSTAGETQADTNTQ